MTAKRAEPRGEAKARLSDDAYSKLREMAQADLRTVANTLNLIIDAEYQRRKKREQ